MPAMKWIADTRTVELTERNLSALLAKLDDPASVRTLVSPCRALAVHAIEDGADPDAAAAETLACLTATRRVPVEPVVVLCRSQLAALAGTVCGALSASGVCVVSVPDSAHYKDRNPGPVVMPTSGERY
ncbi:hypothetical protein [Mycobacterium sp. OTB74]|jgi:hypothetical protein|uniref:hypothetical protein n=1 Tax=Mycobacterium sp. OTB74 TaxID=1853452 RepID=UPI0024767C50|nr:hypothetical protein [Mycobacterium sp. OTB74]MDH6245497.1 hypothetical protein [Mycobacterium sp. OTB74]